MKKDTSRQVCCLAGPTCQFSCVSLKMVGPKMQDFCPRNNMLKGICFKTILQQIMVRKKVSKLYFESKFSMSKIKLQFLNNFIF